MADKKLTDVDSVSSASDSDSLIVIKNGVSKSVKQILLSDLNIAGGGSGTGVVVQLDIRKSGGNIEYKALMSDGSWTSWKTLISIAEITGEPGTPGVPGKNGISPAISIGSVETVENSVPAEVTKTGTDTNPVFNFKIPKGKNGEGAGDVTTEMLNAAIKTHITDKNFLPKSEASNTYATKENIPFKFRKMNKSEYDQLYSKDNNTVYMIVG